MGGAIIGYLLGPTLPFGQGHLPIETILTAGGNLTGLDTLLRNMAQEAFNALLICSILGAAAGFGFARFRPQVYQQPDDTPNSVESITEISPGFILITHETVSPPSIELGQTVSEVQSILREKPKTVVKLGGKHVYIYKEMKITFVEGKVTDVQV
jgi:hypothetical protein